MCGTGYRANCYPLQLSGPTSAFISASDHVAFFGYKVMHAVITVPMDKASSGIVDEVGVTSWWEHGAVMEDWACADTHK